MAAGRQKKVDASQTKPHFLEDTKLCPLIDSLFEMIEKDDDSQPKHQTIQVQLTTKDYDNRKDPKMTKEIVFDTVMRKKPSMVIIGDTEAAAVAKEMDVPCIVYSNFEGKTPEMIKKRQKAVKPYNYVILCTPGASKVFSPRELIMKGKSHFMCPSVENLSACYKQCLNKYKLKIRDWNSVSFPVGHTGLSKDQVKENLSTSILFLIEHLKKGVASIKKIYVKLATSSPIRLH